MHEQNPLMRRLMVRFGAHAVIWVVFVVAVAIVILAHWLVLNVYESFIMQIGYVIVGLFVSLVQLAVWRTNMTGRFNKITKALLSMNRRLS